MFSLAQFIGPNTLELVLKLYSSDIPVYDSYRMDFLISSDIFAHSQIERAASLTLELTTINFPVFESILINL